MTSQTAFATLRRPSRADVDRSLRELETLWRPPDTENETAPVSKTEAADNENSKRADTTPASGLLQIEAPK